jgi:MYXO-CTERM domain-containing protein
MPKNAPSIAILSFLLLQQGADGAFAQGGTVPAPNVAEEQGETEVSPGDGGFDWGWLGLIGLAGLAGLAGRRRS